MLFTQHITLSIQVEGNVISKFLVWTLWLISNSNAILFKSIRIHVYSSHHQFYAMSYLKCWIMHFHWLLTAAIRHLRNKCWQIIIKNISIHNQQKINSKLCLTKTCMVKRLLKFIKNKEFFIMKFLALVMMIKTFSHVNKIMKTFEMDSKNPSQ